MTEGIDGRAVELYFALLPYLNYEGREIVQAAYVTADADTREADAGNRGNVHRAGAGRTFHEGKS